VITGSGNVILRTELLLVCGLYGESELGAGVCAISPRSEALWGLEFCEVISSDVECPLVIRRGTPAGDRYNGVFG